MKDRAPHNWTSKRPKATPITWSDGQSSHYTLAGLRSMCPCAHCREERDRQAKESRLTVLPGNESSPMTITRVELVATTPFASSGRTSTMPAFTLSSIFANWCNCLPLERKPRGSGG